MIYREVRQFIINVDREGMREISVVCPFCDETVKFIWAFESSGFTCQQWKKYSVDKCTHATIPKPHKRKQKYILFQYDDAQIIKDITKLQKEMENITCKFKAFEESDYGNRYKISGAFTDLREKLCDIESEVACVISEQPKKRKKKKS